MKTKLHLIVFLLLCTNLFSQVNPIVIHERFPDCYTKSYTFNDLERPFLTGDMASNGNLYSFEPNGGLNQQFLIMPTFPGSHEAFIICRSTGWIVDRNLSTNNLYCNSQRTHGGYNQRFKFEPLSNNSYFVYSSGTDMVMDRGNFGIKNNNLYCQYLNNGNNQRFVFNPSLLLSNNLSTSVIPSTNQQYASLPPQLLSLNEQYTHEKKFGEMLVGRTLVPFTLINDPQYNIAFR